MRQHRKPDRALGGDSTLCQKPRNHKVWDPDGDFKLFQSLLFISQNQTPHAFLIQILIWPKNFSKNFRTLLLYIYEHAKTQNLKEYVIWTYI